MKKKMKKVLVAALASSMVASIVGVPVLADEMKLSAGYVVVSDSILDGQYTASVRVGGEDCGFDPYDMDVTVEVTGGAIGAISYAGVEAVNEPYAASAAAVVSDQLVGKMHETVEVDGVSGATYSSEGMVSAVSMALVEATLEKPNIKSIQATKSGMKVTWKKISGVDKYVVYRNDKKIKTLTAASYVDKKAKTNGKKYTYRVVALKGGAERYSDKKVGYYLSANQVNTMLNGTAGKMTFTWNYNKKASGYQLQYGTKKSFKKAKTLTTKEKTGVLANASGIVRGKTYYARVRAYKKVGKKKYYGVWSKTKKTKATK